MKQTPLEYIYDYLVKNVLGLQVFELRNTHQSISLLYRGKTLELRSDFLSHCLNINLKDQPLQPLQQLDLSKHQIFDTLQQRFVPIIYGTDKVDITEDKVELGLDIFGSCFFMLSRWEEYVVKDRDNHDRFPVSASLAFQEGFLERPIVDEYVEILWCCIHQLWPELSRKKHSFKQYVSCDIDYLRLNYRKPLRFIKTLAGDILIRKSFNNFWASIKSVIRGINPVDTFDYMMNVCEQNNIQQAYYFIARRKKEKIDGDYNILDKQVISLIKKIRNRGHEIGLHPSYKTYLDEEKTLEEYKLLIEAVERAGGNPEEVIGGRQHFLRWKTPITASNWVAMGMQYDTTMSYAQHVGFRCGTCREYPFYDIYQQRVLRLIIRPLIVMDGTILNKQYMGLSEDEALARVKHLKGICREYNGNFSLLWHNSFFEKRSYFDLFKKMIEN